jgi:hypothetical protein
MVSFLQDESETKAAISKKAEARSVALGIVVCCLNSIT